MIIYFILDIPTQVPPLTPGTNVKMAEALRASFSSWEKERVKYNAPKGECRITLIKDVGEVCKFMLNKQKMPENLITMHSQLQKLDSYKNAQKLNKTRIKKNFFQKIPFQKTLSKYFGSGFLFESKGCQNLPNSSLKR